MSLYLYSKLGWRIHSFLTLQLVSAGVQADRVMGMLRSGTNDRDRPRPQRQYSGRARPPSASMRAGELAAATKTSYLMTRTETQRTPMVPIASTSAPSSGPAPVPAPTSSTASQTASSRAAVLSASSASRSVAFGALSLSHRIAALQSSTVELRSAVPLPRLTRLVPKPVWLARQEPIETEPR